MKWVTVMDAAYSIDLFKHHNAKQFVRKLHFTYGLVQLIIDMEIMNFPANKYVRTLQENWRVPDSNPTSSLELCQPPD